MRNIFLKNQRHFSQILFFNFIELEEYEKYLTEEYLNTFQDRFLHIEEEKELITKTKKIKDVSIKSIEGLKNNLTERMKPIEEINLLLEKALEIYEGNSKNTSFKFQEKEFNKKTIEEGYIYLIQEREKIFKTDFKDWDINFCTTHLAIAQEKSKDTQLLKIYK